MVEFHIIYAGKMNTNKLKFSEKGMKKPSILLFNFSFFPYIIFYICFSFLSQKVLEQSSNIVHILKLHMQIIFVFIWMKPLINRPFTRAINHHLSLSLSLYMHYDGSDNISTLCVCPPLSLCGCC